MDAEILMATSSRSSTMTAGIFLISAYPTILKIRRKSSRLILSISDSFCILFPLYPCRVSYFTYSVRVFVGVDGLDSIYPPFSEEFCRKGILPHDFFCIVQGHNLRENRWVLDLPNIKYFGVTNCRHGTSS